MTSLRPIPLAALLGLAAASAMAADAPPQPPPYSSSLPLPHPPPLAEEGRVGGAGERRDAGAAFPSPLAGQPLDLLSATRERPLFSPTRRPPPPPPPVIAAPEPPPPPPPPPDVALFGIVMDGDEARAVVRAGPAGKTMRVGVGDDIGGWKVAQIEERRLVLALDGRIATFMMFAGSSANAAPRVDRETQSADRQPQSQTQPQTRMRQNPPAPYDPAAKRPHRPRG